MTRCVAYCVKKSIGGDMFEDNWYLFLLLVMVAFFSDGEVSTKEAYVMISILLALTLTNNLDEEEDENGNTNPNTTTNANCYCNKT